MKVYPFNFNNKCKSPFKLREGFRNVARPILISEFKKRGIGLTPMQRLLVALGVDLKKDIQQIVIPIKAQGAMIIDALKETTMYYKGYGGAPKTTAAYTPAPSESGSEVHEESEATSNGQPVTSNQEPVINQQGASDNLTNVIDEIQLKRGSGSAVSQEYQEEIASDIRRRQQTGKPIRKRKKYVKKKKYNPED